MKPSHLVENDMKKMLNIGCGHRFHKDWVNIDIDPASPEVKKVNILQGLPYPDNSFDVVYHSNVLEHLPKQKGAEMISECFRVLNPGGILRINVPDLEKICREYLLNMEKAISGNEIAAHNYDWILIEMLDQVGRNKGGGEMAEYLSQPQLPNIEFLRHRLGSYIDEWRQKMNDLHYLKASASNAAPSSGESRSKLTQLSILLVTGVLNSILENPVFLSSLSIE